MPGCWVKTANSKPEYGGPVKAEVPANDGDRILSSEDVMRRRATLLQRLHIDGPLLILLLTPGGGQPVCPGIRPAAKGWDLLSKQATSFGIGLVSMFIIAQLEPRFMALGADRLPDRVMLLVVVDIMGHNAMGATRWINIPGSLARNAALGYVIVSLAWWHVWPAKSARKSQAHPQAAHG